MIKIFFFFFVFLIFSCTKKTNESLEKLEKLNSAANFLMLVSDDEKLITNNCNIKSAEALKLILTLHAMIDEEKQKLHLTENDLTTENCQQTCQCGLYAVLSKNTIQSETFLKLHRSKNLYNKSLPFSPWLFSISRSVFLDFLKRKTT